jgi:MFS family permease
VLARGPLDSPAVAITEAIVVPPLIRRNAWLLTIAEAFVGTSQQMVPTLSSIIIGTMLGGATFAGAGSSLMGLSRVVVSYPPGALADRWGRKPVLLRVSLSVWWVRPLWDSLSRSVPWPSFSQR